MLGDVLSGGEHLKIEDVMQAANERVSYRHDVIHLKAEPLCRSVEFLHAFLSKSGARPDHGFPALCFMDEPPSSAEFGLCPFPALCAATLAVLLLPPEKGSPAFLFVGVIILLLSGAHRGAAGFGRE